LIRDRIHVLPPEQNCSLTKLSRERTVKILPSHVAIYMCIYVCVGHADTLFSLMMLYYSFLFCFPTEICSLEKYNRVETLLGVLGCQKFLLASTNTSKLKTHNMRPMTSNCHVAMMCGFLDWEYPHFQHRLKF